jgi:glycine cleavage system H protein
MSDEIPEDLRYTKDHEWARKEGTALVVGITAHAVEQLGDITLVTLPEVGTEVEQGAAFGDIDSVKAVSELFAPVTGKIIATNEALEASPELVNESPYDKGWLVKIEPSNPSQLDGLLDAAAYRELTAER